MMMPAGAESAGLRANDAAISGDIPGQDGQFSGLMARFDGTAPTTQAMSDPLPDDVNLPPDGEVLPAGLPFSGADPAAMFTLPQSALESLAVRMREALAGGAPGVPVPGSVARGQAAVTNPAILDLLHPDLLHPGARLPVGEGAVALQPELAQNRMEPAGLALQLATQLPPTAVSMNALLQRQGDATTLAQSDGLRGLIRVAEAATAELLPSSSMHSGQQLPGLTQSVERSLPGWTLSTPLHQAQQWGDEIGQRIRWMVGNQVHAAELRINPPQLGPIEVRVSVQNDQMNISFLSQHALVRDTLEDAIPRLRDLLNQQGFTSVNVDVSQRQTQEDQGHDDRGQGLRAGDESGLSSSDPDMKQHSAYAWSTSTGVIDFYA